ncbi:MAG: MogA/MoaB family molybdenum cofactor biosynthesis protein [Leptolyngbyaceae cyanobacterium SM2_5_2]|nr:MogA/MoaB family molybdenum cofactor biosynthesis protein [Leptolyngbyaceae cyanobacterium SM2_5_2]
MPHPTRQDKPINCAVITISDTRTPATDQSGQLIQTLLSDAGQTILDYRILPDEADQIRALCEELGQNPGIDAVILTGGTGIAPRDTTYDAVESLLEKTLPGFGEIFRQLSFQEIGSRAIASRALAGVYESTLFFSLPGSSKAVKLAMAALILPELPHLVGLLKP